MKKRFVTHKNKFRVLKLILWVSIIYLSLVITFNLLFKKYINTIITKEDKYISIMNYALNEDNTFDLNLLNPQKILSFSLNHILSEEDSSAHYTDILLIDKEENDTNPLVYIYNTHQTESYDSSLLQAYNISYTVQTASYILRDYLKSYGISCYVESESMSKYLSSNGLVYKNSYQASRYYITKRMEEYTSINFLIDLHRDSVPGSVTKVQIDGVNYAKILFVVGMDHDNYSKNLALAEDLNSKLDRRLTRGISKKTGSNVNGIYNQDINESSILIEIGGVDNTIDEVNNTLKVVAKVIFEYMSGE